MLLNLERFCQKSRSKPISVSCDTKKRERSITHNATLQKGSKLVGIEIVLTEKNFLVCMKYLKGRQVFRDGDNR